MCALHSPLPKVRRVRVHETHTHTHKHASPPSSFNMVLQTYGCDKRAVWC